VLQSLKRKIKQAGIYNKIGRKHFGKKYTFKRKEKKTKQKKKNKRKGKKELHRKRKKRRKILMPYDLFLASLVLPNQTTGCSSLC
jgi:hypothetical protein